jgi:oxygen-independent coproporphyrinogen-3 oxidase
MPGIYVHIPFCKQACHYCDFHFSTSLQLRGELLAAISQEMEWRRDYLGKGELNSIYFGGGTPSLLRIDELNSLFDRIFALWPVAANAEITLEANPDDMSREKIKELRRTPVNRLSLGIQSFHEEDLRFFNRAHNAIEARACIEYAQDLGYENLSIDLIYGSPTTSNESWEHNLQITFDYEIPHVSAYCLTVEEKTALHHFIQTGKAPPLSEDKATLQFQILMKAMRAEGYEHYEISNFALPGRHARHNSAYWQGEPYLGLGPSAHSFSGESRQWNVANNAKYIRLVQALAQPGGAAGPDQSAELFTIEALSPRQRYNEYVLTALRTHWGAQLKAIPEDFRSHFLEHIHPFLIDESIERKRDVFRLTDKGKLMADRIAMELFLVEG